MTKLLQVAVPVVLAMLSLMPRVDAPTHTGIHEGILLRECDGGTAWNQVETGDCPLTSPTQGIQPVVWCTRASRKAVSYSKKPRRLRQKRLKICSRLNIILLLLLLLSGDIETNPGPNTSINSPSVCGRKETAYRSSAPLTFVRNIWMSILLWQTEVAITGDKLVQEEIMMYNIDVYHTAVERTLAPKTTMDMRKNKLAHQRLQQCNRPGWIRLGYMADPFIACIVVVLIMIYTQNSKQKWNPCGHHSSYSVATDHKIQNEMSRKSNHRLDRKTVYTIALYCLVYYKIEKNFISSNHTVLKLVKHCSHTGRKVYMYLQTDVFTLVSAGVIAMKLLLSGDIELNPGPLTVDDLKKVLNSLWEARAKWIDIGIQLDMKVRSLEAIKHDHNEVGSCLRVMLTDWLNQVDPPPTWEALLDALKSPTVGCAKLAGTIEKTYCKKVDPPQITQHPANLLNVVHGSQVTFTVAANTDAGTLTYQWQLNGASIDPSSVGVSGVTTNTLTINNVQESNAGVYTCVVSNAPKSTITSNGAQLTLIEPPQIMKHPTNQLNVVRESQVTFTVAANTDAGTLTYQWQRNGASIDPSSVGVSGVTTNTLTINNVQESNTGVYTCVVSNAPKSTITSNGAQLTLIEPPQIMKHPTNQLNVVRESQVTFTVAANTDAGTLTYQWQLNGASIDPSSVGVSGVTTNTLTINNVQESNTGVYTCVVSNAPKSTITSNGAQLTLIEPPQIMKHPTNQLNVVRESQVTFTVAANTDAGTLTYQWQRNGASIDPSSVGVSGVTTNTLTINNVQESNTGVYTCVVSNAPKSTITSNGAQLTLIEPPQIMKHPTNQLNVVRESQVTFTVAANTDAGTLTYQWQLNGASIDPSSVGVSGVTTNTLTINNVQESNTGVYTCVVSNAPKSTITSNGAQLTLIEPPQIMKHPTNQLNVVRESQVTFTVAANTDAGTLTYQWQLNGASIDPSSAGVCGVTTNSLTINNVQESNTGVYTCVVSNTPMSTTTSNGAQLKLKDTPVHVNNINSSSQELQSGLQHEQSITSNPNGASTGSSNVLSRHPPFLQLSSSEWEELKAMLDDDVRDVKHQFCFLVTKTRDSLEKRQIPVEKYATSILALGAYEPVPEEQNKSLLNEHREEIKMATSISEIFNILSAYWNYLNYEILEITIELYGTSDDEQRLERYNEHLQIFCERRIFELSLPENSCSSSNTLSSKQEKVAVKLNVCEDSKCNELLRIRSRIAKILRVKLATLIIDGVDAGCVQLTLLIPRFVAQEIFPLSNEQMTVLHKDASVIRLECGDYVFENASKIATEDHLTMSLEGLEDSAASADPTDQELSKAVDFIHEDQFVCEEVRDQCVHEEVIEESKLQLELAQQKEIMEPEGGTEPNGSPKEDDWKETIPGGYDCKFVEQPPTVFQTDCPVCRLLLRDPYQATCCGTSFCCSCIEQLQVCNNICPTCRKDNFEVSPNKGLKRSLNQLQVFCTHRKDGCTWTGELGELDHHLIKVIHSVPQSSSDVSNVSEVDSTPLATQSRPDATDGSEVTGIPLVPRISVLTKTQQTLQDSHKLHSTSEVQRDPEDTSRSIRSHYANTLKDKYRSGVPTFLTLQWPPPPTRKVFNLAMISQRALKYGHDEELVRLLQKGDVSSAVSSRNTVTLEQISDNLHSKSRKIILIEGAPGAGKSTLAWHLCNRWEAGELFQEFEIVLFVQLREPAVQFAKCFEDLLPTDSDMRSEVVSAIQYCGGHQILIVLDSWDEFKPGLNQESVIKNLICNPSILKMPFSALIITSRPIATASLQWYISSRIEIAGFLQSEITRYFDEAIGDPKIVQKLSDRLRERPVIEASCYLPLNTAIVTHVFLAQNCTLPTTLHGMFTSLVKCCIKRHLKREAKEGEVIPKILSLEGLPPGIQEQFKNLCILAYHGVRKNKATFSEEDLQSFKIPSELSTLSLMQGVTSFTDTEESKLYNFLHLSTQELLAAFHISKLQPHEQVKLFNELFEQPRFANVFNFYAGFTKLKTAGIQDTVTSIVKSKNKILILSLLHCLYEAQDDTLCQFVSSQLEAELDLTVQTLSPVDCLSVGYTARSVCSTTAGRFKLKLTTTRFDEYGAKLMLKELSKYSTPSVPETAGKTKELQNLHLELYGERSTSSFAEQATIISKLGQYLRVLNLWDNQIGNAGAESLGTALKECTKLESLNLGSNELNDGGVDAISTSLTKLVHLQELYLSDNQLGDGGVHVISTSLTKLVHLHTLYLEGNQISDSGCVTLCDAVRHCTELQVLSLGENQISDSGCITLCDAVRHCTELQVLSLYDNRISDSSIRTLCVVIKSMKCLKRLDLGLNEFTEKGKTQLREAAAERNRYPDFVKLHLSV